MLPRGPPAMYRVQLQAVRYYQALLDAEPGSLEEGVDDEGGAAHAGGDTQPRPGRRPWGSGPRRPRGPDPGVQRGGGNDRAALRPRDLGGPHRAGARRRLSYH